VVVRETGLFEEYLSTFAYMKHFSIIILLLSAASSYADGLCKRQDKIDPEYPAGLAGKYEIIGRLPDSNTTYTGLLEIINSKSIYLLKRSVEGVTTTGKAWIEICGPDEIMFLRFNFHKQKDALDGSCLFRYNADNYFLISCYTSFVGKNYKKIGLESMFQLQ
jgi:hypothetical protein